MTRVLDIFTEAEDKGRTGGPLGSHADFTLPMTLYKQSCQNP